MKQYDSPQIEIIRFDLDENLLDEFTNPELGTGSGDGEFGE